jgi:hypothetical protein
MSPALIIQRDGISDEAPGPFETRAFAEAVASMTTSHERVPGRKTSNAPDRPNRRRWKLGRRITGRIR